MNIITAAVLVLAVWRISAILVREEGPYSIFAVLRYWLGIRENDDEVYVEWIDNKHRYTVGQLLLCIYCTSVWVALVIASIYWVHPPLAFAVSLPFALSAAALLVDKVVNA